MILFPGISLEKEKEKERKKEGYIKEKENNAGRKNKYIEKKSAIRRR